MKRCKDCKHNKRDGKHFRCEIEGHITDWNQNECKDCVNFKAKKKVNLDVFFVPISIEEK